MARPKNEQIEQMMQSEGISRRTAMRRLADVRKLNPSADIQRRAAELLKEEFVPSDVASIGDHHALRVMRQWVTQQEFDALTELVNKLTARVDKLEKAKQPLNLVGREYAGAIQSTGKGKESPRHPTLGERSSKNELPRRI